MDEFGTDDECRTVLQELRWPEGPKCPRCGSDKLSRIYERGQFDCDSCRYQFSVTVGTVLHDTHLPLRKWFIATFLMCESKKGMSALQLQRTLGVSYKTAWYLQHRIRAAMGGYEEIPLSGHIEADETWIGGKRKGMGQGYVENKSQVLGVIQRGGEIRLAVHERGRRADSTALQSFVKSVVSADTASTVYTDENPGYIGLAGDLLAHEAVNHAAEEWVHGDAHTNSAESAWSLFKRSIVGPYHQLSVKHLPAYLGEFEWRFNNRENPYLFRDTLMRLLAAEKLPYKALVEGV